MGNGTDCVPEDILLSFTLAMDPALFALSFDALKQFFADLAGVPLAGVQVTRSDFPCEGRGRERK